MVAKRVSKKAPAKKRAALKPIGPKYLVREQRLLRLVSCDESGHPRIPMEKRVYADGMTIATLVEELSGAISAFGDQARIELETDPYWCFGHDDGYCYCGPPTVELVLHGYRQLTPNEEKVWNDIQTKKEKYERSNGV